MSNNRLLTYSTHVPNVFSCFQRCLFACQVSVMNYFNSTCKTNQINSVREWTSSRDVGVVDHNKDVASRLAREGYVAL